MTTSPIAHPSALETDTAIDVVVGISLTVFNALNSVAASSPFAPAASICLAILTTAGNAKGNKQNFRELARDACELVYAVISQGANGDSARSRIFQRQVDHLIKVLKDIEKFSTKRASKGFVHRFVTVSPDEERIKNYRAQLEQRLKVFNLQSNVSIREMVEEILKRQKNQQAYANDPKLEPTATPGVAQSAILINGNANTVNMLEFVNGNKVTNQTNFVHGIPRPGPQFLPSLISM
ncbi:hypothetical protein B0H12DRAFT_51444 [Mycena haematopus]|nr:hypothetical protein B0H12DRAFT_51444 [Mycena haematopus]